MGAIAMLLVALGIVATSLFMGRRYGSWSYPIVGVTVGAVLVCIFTVHAAWVATTIIAVIGLVLYVGTRLHDAGRRAGGFVAAALAIAVVASVTGLALLGTNGSNTAEAQPTSTPDADTVKALTVTTIDEAATCKTDSNGLVAWNIGTLKPVASDGRKWSDSVEVPFTETDRVKVLQQVMTTNCENPLYGVHNANAFANMILGDIKVLDLNSWLVPFEGDGAKVINTKAAAYMPLLDVKNPTDAQVTEAVKQNKEWQGVAARLNTLLLKFTLGDVRADSSVLNYHLLAGGLTAGNLPAIGLNDKQESLPALQLYLTNKGQESCFAKIGYNMGDRRFEQFKCSTPPGPAPTTTHPGTPGTPPPGCKENCTTTTTSPPPGCTQNCTPTTPGCTGGDCSSSPPPECPSFGKYPNCYGPKSPAPQPSGVEKPTNNPLGPVQPSPPPKHDPLKPSHSASSQPTAPGASPVPSYSPPPPATGAPEPSQVPSSCAAAPGHASC